LHDSHKIADNELKKYSDYSYRLDKLESFLIRARKSGKNADDLLFDLKLTRNKLKEGHFKMVNMYLTQLESNIKKLGFRIQKDL
jgi:hypothetical protein